MRFPSAEEVERDPGHVLLATLEDPDGTVHTKSTILRPDWFEVEERAAAAATAETTGLVGSLSR